jgi:hypothetical protein
VTSEQLARTIGCSRQWVFYLRKKFPDRCPKNFDDVEGWKELLALSRTQAKVKYVRAAAQPRSNGANGDELSDIQRLTRGRADKVQTENQILEIELQATRRQVIRQEEAIALFGKVAAVVRARLMKMRNDLPNALLGLDAPAIDKVLAEKMEEVLATLVIPDDFFTPRGVI